MKAFMSCLTSDKADIVDFIPSKEYVKPFSQGLNATHDERCYYEADQSVAIERAIYQLCLVFVDAHSRFWHM